MRRLVCIGRGGVGKSCFIALATRYLSQKASVFVIDADPDQSLAQMLDIDLEKEGIKTISEILFDVREGKVTEKLKKAPLAQRIEYLINQDGIYEGKGFDFLCLGTKWTEGCYCQANNILKEILSNLKTTYEFVLIDSPAGLEHLNRRVTSSIEDIFVIVDPSRKAYENIRRAYRIISEIKIIFENFYVVANFKFTDKLLDELKLIPELKYIGKIDYDSSLEELIFKGESIWSLKDDSISFLSIKNILEKAGY